MKKLSFKRLLFSVFVSLLLLGCTPNALGMKKHLMKKRIELDKKFLDYQLKTPIINVNFDRDYESDESNSASEQKTINNTLEKSENNNYSIVQYPVKNNSISDKIFEEVESINKKSFRSTFGELEKNHPKYKRSIYIVKLKNNEAIGYVDFYNINKKISIVNRLAIKSKYQCQGFGTKLIYSIFKNQQNTTEIFLDSSEIAFDFYKKIGFVENTKLIKVTTFNPYKYNSYLDLLEYKYETFFKEYEFVMTKKEYLKKTK